jgi:hypothetical protein
MTELELNAGTETDKDRLQLWTIARTGWQAQWQAD